MCALHVLKESMHQQLEVPPAQIAQLESIHLPLVLPGAWTVLLALVQPWAQHLAA